MNRCSAILVSTLLLVNAAACGGGDDTSGEAPAAGGGGSGDGSGSAGTAGDSGAGGSVDAGSQEDAAPDSDASAQPDASDASSVEAAAPCATAIWQLERHCGGGDFIGEARVSGGALELMSSGRGSTCEPDEERPGDLSVVQSGLEGDFTIQVDMESFEGATDPSRSPFFSVGVAAADQTGAAAAIMKDSVNPAINLMASSMSTDNGQTQGTIQSILGDVNTIMIARTGTAMSVEFPGTSFKSTGVASAGPMQVRLVISGAGDLADTATVARVSAFTVTPEASIQSDTFDCNSIEP